MGLWVTVTGGVFLIQLWVCDKEEGLHCVLNFWHGQRSFVAVPNSPGSKTVTVHRGQWLCPVTNCSSHGCCREEEETHLIP